MTSETPAPETLVGRTALYVRRRWALRWALILTCINHGLAIVLISLRQLTLQLGGFLAMLSVLTWFFGVALPVMNREVRIQLGGERTSYWSDVVERFALVVVCLQTLLYTVALCWAAASPW